MRIAILTYHSINVGGNDYAGNDHVALRDDLALIHALGIPVVRLRDVVAALHGEAPVPARKAVALTCDDGAWFDWHDLPHPVWGDQPGFRTLLSLAAGSVGPVPMTSFVIASPDARSELDRTCMVGRGWWGDEWWSDAAAAGIDVQNHSWDHNHDTLPETACGGLPKGEFSAIGRWDIADAEIRQASDYIDSRCGAGHCRLLAYPYGQSSPYLVEEYLPRHAGEHRLRAAFTTEPRPLQHGDNPWTIGRYVCSHHWRSGAELQRLLRDALGS